MLSLVFIICFNVVVVFTIGVVFRHSGRLGIKDFYCELSLTTSSMSQLSKMLVHLKETW